MQTDKEPVPPVRVAIIGGGCAGLTAAWHICQQPGFEVHVYEKSWRLGGKAASVRDETGRILEHGLHVWLGFYENAFRMMRECYAEVQQQRWGPHGSQGERLTHGSIDDAFFPEPNIGVAGLDAVKDWVVWSGHLPPAKGLPGDDLDEETNPFTLTSYLLRCFDLLKALMLSTIGPPDTPAPGRPRPDARSKVDEAIELDFSFDATRSPTVVIERMTQLLRAGTLTTAAALLQAVTMLERWLQQLNQAPQVADSVLELLEAIVAQVRKQLRDLVSVDEKLRWKTEIIDIVMAITVGLYRDRVLFQKKGLDAINHLDYRKWLFKHGATKTSLESRFITGIYDLVFAYRDGDRKRPALAAGVALRGALRMFFTYRGSMFWRCRSGMGDAVIAPLYKVLLLTRKVKGKEGRAIDTSPVRFHFLHTLADVSFDLKDSKNRHVTRLRFTTQGAKGELDDCGSHALDDAGCWPDRPQKRFGRAMETVVEDAFELEYGRTDASGFDAVIFAMGIEDFVQVCACTRERASGKDSPFYEQLPKWAKMSREVKTVATQAAQVWLNADLGALGWHRGPVLVTALDFRFNTWADMTHTLGPEQVWKSATGASVATHHTAPANVAPARSVAYFCGVLSEEEIKSSAAKAKHDHLSPSSPGEQMDKKVLEDLRYLLRSEMRHAWPAAYGARRTAWNLVEANHAQANFQGSDRYTLSLPGSIDDRISPLDRSFVNMTIAGDWTACGLDAGCIEAAVMSGKLAAHAFTGKPSLTSIIGYDHP